LLHSIELRHAAEKVAFSPDGRLLAAGTEGGALLLWEIEF